MADPAFERPAELSEFTASIPFRNCAACFAERLKSFTAMGAEAERARTLRAWGRYEFTHGDQAHGEQAALARRSCDRSRPQRNRSKPHSGTVVQRSVDEHGRPARAGRRTGTVLDRQRTVRPGAALVRLDSEGRDGLATWEGGGFP